MTRVEATVYELIGHVVTEFDPAALTVDLLDAPAGRLTVTGIKEDGTPDTRSFFVTETDGTLDIRMEP